jgi:hypothetical protein
MEDVELGGGDDETKMLRREVYMLQMGHQRLCWVIHAGNNLSTSLRKRNSS